VKFAFVKEHRRRWPVRVMCCVLKVARSGFYAWLKRKPSARQMHQQKLLEKIKVKHLENRELYGSPRVHRALLIDGEVVCRNTVARLMRQARIRAKTKRRFVPRTTDSRHQQPIADNLLQRDFGASQTNRKWVSDITYVATDEGWLFVAAVLDCFSRRIVGWSMCEGMPTDLVADALKMALLQREPSKHLIHHSDRGSQYASDEFQQLLIENNITASMSRRGDCYDNAMMESFWATLKTELIYQEDYTTREQAKQSIFEYIEVFYNRKRLHSSLGYLSPESFEAA
jgi:putative transposase